MKKLITSICAAVLAMGMFTAQAAEIAVIAVYDNAGKLVYSMNVPKTDKGFIFNLPEEYSDCEYKVFNAGSDEYSVSFDVTEQPTEAAAASEMPTETEIPTVTETPEPTQLPAATPPPTKTPYPAVYEKALDAVNAPAVVKSVEETIENGETWYRTTMLYQGTELTTLIYNAVQIESAPAESADLIGKDVTALKEGDIIHFTCDLQGRVRSVEFLLRPSNAAVASVGSDKYSTFYLGVPVEVKRGYVSLMSKNGSIQDIDISSGTFVYTIKPYARGEKVEFTGTGSGGIMRGRADDDWAEASSYVLARVRNGSATEIIQIEN